MTKAEYSAYTAAVKEFCDDQEIAHLASVSDETTFSWQPCDCCRRPLGGDRHSVVGWHPGDKERLPFSICTDCLYFAEYGRLDDETMLAIA